jgi:hypothetical protein
MVLEIAGNSCDNWVPFKFCPGDMGNCLASKACSNYLYINKMKILIVGYGCLGIEAARHILAMKAAEKAILISAEEASNAVQNFEPRIQCIEKIKMPIKNIELDLLPIELNTSNRRTRRKEARRKEKMRKMWLGYGTGKRTD